MKGYVLSEKTYQRLRHVVDGPINGTPAKSEPRPGGPNWQHIRVTGTAIDCVGSGSGAGSGGGSGGLGFRYYPAVVEAFDTALEAPEDYGACVILERHDYPLVVGNVYVGQESGELTVCGTDYVAFVTAIPIAGLETDLNGSGSGDGLSGNGSGGGNGCDAYGTGGAGQGITIPFAACDADGNPCTKELVITLPVPAAWCITDPNGCGG